MTDFSTIGDSSIQLEKLLTGLSKATQYLWGSPDLQSSLQQAIASLGETMDINRIQFFQNGIDSASIIPRINLQFEWTRGRGLDDSAQFQCRDIPFYQQPDELFPALSRGQLYFQPVNKFPESIQIALFHSRSGNTLSMPVMVDHALFSEPVLWGVILFEDYSGTHSWTSHEISILQVIANNIGGAISRARAEEALKESEHRFRIILNSIQAGVIIVQAENGVIVAMNQAANQMIGGRYEKMIGRSIQDVLPSARAIGPNGMNLASDASEESCLITASGETIPVLRRPVHIRMERTPYIVETFLSIAERKQSERVQNEQRLVAEAMREIINAINQSLNLNDVLNAILASLDKVVPNDAANIMLIEDDIARVAACRGYERRGGSERVLSMARRYKEVPNLLKMAQTGLPIVVSDTEDSPDWINSQSSYWIKSYASAPICRGEKTIGYINLNSETRGLYSPAHAERLRSFADQAAIAIENARLYESAQREIDDRKKAEIALQQAKNLLEDRVEQRTLELRQANEQLTQALEYRIQAEMALKEERASLARRVEERTAELRAANSQLAQAARLKDTFLASMSHELRTPLNAILNISETIQEQVYGAMNADQLRSMQRIEESGRHLLSLINDILDLSKIGASKLELVWDYVPVRLLCQSSIQFVEEAARRKNIVLSVEVDPVLKTVWADQRRLKQILVNLLSNAVKFTNENGRVSLTAAADPQRGQAHLRVSDTGIGIAPDRIQYLFKPFVQLDDSLARQYEGTGLGLALAYSLIELHSGGLSVESESGKGSSFTIHLNWKESPEWPGDTGSLQQPAKNSLPRSATPNGSAYTPTTHRLEGMLREYGIGLVPIWIDDRIQESLLQTTIEILVLDLSSTPDGVDLLPTLFASSAANSIPLLVINQAQQDIIPGLVLPANARVLSSTFTRQDLFKALRKITSQGTGSLIQSFSILKYKNRPQLMADRRILVADDNETSARILADYLESRGYFVNLAYNGAEAIERTREDHPDLILMDIQMPGIDGLETIRRIRVDEKLQQIPVIAITALAMPGDRLRCLEAGANEYLSKPLSLKELSEHIEKYLAAR